MKISLPWIIPGAKEKLPEHWGTMFHKWETHQGLFYARVKGSILYDGLTRNFNNISRDNVSCSDPLDTLLVLTVHLSHLWFILLQSLDGVLCVTLLEDTETEPVATLIIWCGFALAEILLPKTIMEISANTLHIRIHLQPHTRRWITTKRCYF